MIKKFCKMNNNYQKERLRWIQGNSTKQNLDTGQQYKTEFGISSRITMNENLIFYKILQIFANSVQFPNSAKNFCDCRIEL